MANLEHNPISAATQAACGAHHNQQFGQKDLPVRALKVAEEAGEVAGAIIRLTEKRNGHDWMPEVRQEIGDVIVTLLNLCDELGEPLADIADEATERFLNRRWKVTKT